MKKLFRVLDRKERKILSWLSLLFAASVLFCFLALYGGKTAVRSSQNALLQKQRDFQKIQAETVQRKKELSLWLEASQDMKEIREKYFYRGKEGVEPLRRDLERIFIQNGVRTSQIRYEYREFEGENIKKIQASFNVTGSYFALKKFIHSIETHPKFLVVEKIDFSNIESQGNRLTLKIVMAGYYEA